MTRAGPIPPLDPCAIHGVERGDTLWGLAARRLGDPHRWPQIYAANRDVVAHPDRIVPGERLRIDCEAPLSSTAAPTRTPP